MKKEKLSMSTILPAAPEKIYDAWLSGSKHTAFTGGNKATASTRIGGRFTAWDGYISGKNLELEHGKRILQSWRSTEFPEDHDDSMLELTFSPNKQGTKLSLKHWDIPAGQAKNYEEGWKEYYFTPMQEYFSPKAS